MRTELERLVSEWESRWRRLDPRDNPHDDATVAVYDVCIRELRAILDSESEGDVWVVVGHIEDAGWAVLPGRYASKAEAQGAITPSWKEAGAIVALARLRSPAPSEGELVAWRVRSVFSDRVSRWKYSDGPEKPRIVSAPETTIEYQALCARSPAPPEDVVERVAEIIAVRCMGGDPGRAGEAWRIAEEILSECGLAPSSRDGGEG